MDNEEAQYVATFKYRTMKTEILAFHSDIQNGKIIHLIQSQGFFKK